MKPELLRGLGAAALLVVAIAGLAAFDAARFQPRDVAWTFATTDLATEDGRLAEGETAQVAVLVAGPNVRAVTFALAWADDVGDGDAFELRVEGPQGQNATLEPDGSGSLVARVAVAEPPSQLAAPNAAAAQHLAAMVVDPASGVGEWRATIRLASAPGAPLPVGPVESQADGANDWALVVSLETYAPR